MSAQVAVWKPAFAAVDRARDGWTWLRRHPALPVAAVTALLIARPRRVLRWARRGWFVWLGLRRVHAVLLSALAGQLPGER